MVVGVGEDLESVNLGPILVLIHQRIEILSLTIYEVLTSARQVHIVVVNDAQPSFRDVLDLLHILTHVLLSGCAPLSVIDFMPLCIV